MSEPDCKKCAGQGVVKVWYDGWHVTECDRCRGFGVDPDALPAQRDMEASNG